MVIRNCFNNDKSLRSGIAEIWDTLLGLWDPVLKPMLIGSVPLGVMFGMAAYVITRWAAVTFNQARKRRKEKKSGVSVNP